MAECPVCEMHHADVRGGGGDFDRVDCPRCGKFQISETAAVNLRRDGPPWQLRVACWLRHVSLSGAAMTMLKSDDLERFKASWRDRTVAEKQDALLSSLAKMSKHPGDAVTLVANCDHVLAWCEFENEFAYHLQAMQAQGLAIAPTMDPEWIITPAGWNRVAKNLSRDHFSTDLVFVAMAFDPMLADAWSDGLQPGIKAAGYRPERVDTGHHAGKIDDRIMAMIREARFVVVDVTTQNRGAYFEAGFALGLDRQVIWSVRGDDLPNVHFDTRQFNHVVWSDPADLRNKIEDRVLGVFGRGPVR